MRATLLLALAALSLLPDAAAAQGRYVPRRLEGPRVGITIVTGKLAERLDEEFGVVPVISQFGWQFETQLYRTEDSSLTAVTEWVPLVGGLEQGLILPSLTWIVGLRTGGGAEFGVGPNVSAAGTGLAITSGVNIRSNGLNLPLNLAVVPAREGVRVSVLGGFNTRR